MTGLLILTLGIITCALLAACGRGTRTPGPSWFDMPHIPMNRAARRQR